MIDFDATVLAAGMAAFGELVAWLPAEYPSAQVPAVFYDNAREVSYQDGVEVIETATLLSARASAFARPPVQNDLFQVRGRLYAVTEARPDGVGAITVRLRLATDADARRAPLNPVAAVA